MVHIGFLLDSFEIGGTELNAIKVAESLYRHSATLTVFHFQQKGALKVRYEQLGAEMVHVPLHGLFSTSARRAIATVSGVAHERGVQLLHSHCVYSNIIGIGIRRFTRHKLPLLASRRWTGYSARRGLHTLNRFAQSSADAVLVNSPSLLQTVQRESPFSRPVYIPNMLPENNFRAASAVERRERRRALLLPEDAPLVGCVARLVPVKDHRTLLEAWRLISRQVPAAHLVIIGGGNLRTELESLTEAMGLAASVHFTGEVQPESLPHALLDVSVLASSDEGFPNSLLEAMAQNIPVVSTDVGGVRDLITNGENGLLVPKARAREMSDAIVAILNDSALASRIGRAGAATAQRHRESAVLPQLLSTYERLIRS